MKVIIAPDSFKGSLSAREVADSINKGIKKASSEIETILLPVGDGGEGTMDVLVSSTGGRIKNCEVTGPSGDSVNADYGILGDGTTCVIEMASASGLNLVPLDDQKVLKSTSYGTGELIVNALNKGYKSFIIAIGGSATNDGGLGMLQALGLKALDKDGNVVGDGGGELHKITEIDISEFDERILTSNFIIASDVQNPLIGLQGASHVFGPQKGASQSDVEFLDAGMENWADVILNKTGIKLHDKNGAGAAGGIGGAFQAFFPSDFKNGIDVVLDEIKLNDYLKDTSLVITGEGRVDNQTIFGKTPFGVAERAYKKSVPTIILAGSVGEGTEELHSYGVIGIYSIINQAMTLEEAMENTGALLEDAAFQITTSQFYNEIVGQRGLYV